MYVTCNVMLGAYVLGKRATAAYLISLLLALLYLVVDML